MTTAVSSAPFYRAHARTLNAQSLSFDALCPPGDRLAARVLVEYGAMFVAAPDVVPPSVCVFADEVEVAAFQRSVPCAEALIAGYEIRLQQSALESLLRARHEARNAKLDITPRDGAEAARRTFADGVRLWDSRVRPALAHWIANGRLSEAEAERLRSLAPREQALAVLDLEAEGMFFSKDFSKPVLQSIAAPGTSQHLAMLAFDVVEFNDAAVRRVLRRHGWFQTVVSDLPHFTYLGWREEELAAHGLCRTGEHDRPFWIPNLSTHTTFDEEHTRR